MIRSTGPESRKLLPALSAEVPTGRMFAPFPHPESFEVDGLTLGPEEVIARLTPYVSERRRGRIASVVQHRTFSVVPVMDGLHDMGNVNAVLRTADGLGFGAAHLVALQGEAGHWAAGWAEGVPLAAGAGTAKRQSQGADKWIDLHVWPSADVALQHLRDSGYRIAATHLAPEAVPIGEVDFTIPTAVIFGNESEGVSEQMLAQADLTVVIPLHGFVQSFNISVAAAIALYQARADRLARQGRHGDLGPRERQFLTAAYYLRAARNAGALLRAGP